MALSPTEISAALLSIPEKRDSLRKAFGDLEEHRALIASSSRGWNELDSSLSTIYETLEKRHAEIVEKETKFEERMTERQDALDKRESVIESREQASLARVQEQKDAAIAAIREQKRKWIEEKQLLQSQSAAKPDTEHATSKPRQKDGNVQKDEPSRVHSGGTEKDNAGAKEMEANSKHHCDSDVKKGSKGIASSKSNQKTATPSGPKKVTASSKTSKKIEETLKLDDPAGTVQASTKLEEAMESKTDTEVTSEGVQKNAPQEQAEEAHGKPDSEDEDAEGSTDHPEAMEIVDEDGVKAVDEDASDDDEKEGSQKKMESSHAAATPRSELISLCEKMDGPGLFTFLIAQKRVIKDIQKELPTAMRSAPDASQLVLQAIKQYHPSESGTEGAQVKKLATRRSCITLLESLSALLDSDRKTGNVIPDDLKEKAKSIAESWKSKLNPKENERTAQLDAQSFLQLVATFGLASSFDEDELCDLVMPICFRKQAPKLWRSLGLAHKASDLVDRLIKDLKHLDAVSFVQEYQLDEKFPPVTLLKGYLREIRKGHTNSSSVEDKDGLHMKELNAARAVLKCVERYKLAGEYPVEGLQRRIAQLEKLGSGDKKRVADTITGGPKKARAVNGPGGPFRPGDRFGGRGNGGRSYGLPYSRGGGGYAHPSGGRGYPSPFSHGGYHYGGGPPYQGPYMR